MNEEQKKPADAWYIYQGKGDGAQHDGIERLLQLQPPPWRKFAGLVREQEAEAALTADPQHDNPGRGRTYIAAPEQVRLVNTALYLRRPLLITGRPGTGKSSLAYAVAWELKLGPVLRWPITSRTTLADGLYRYDAIGRLQETQLEKDNAALAALRKGETPEAATERQPSELPDIGKYLSLGPLGTALLPSSRPRVLLIDEIDKSDIDLPNDLLNIFEEGEYEIPELARYPASEVQVRLHGSTQTATIEKGRVRCQAFPFVVMTSNREREFPPPLLRRCLRLDINPPNPADLARIVEAHLKEQLGDELAAKALTMIDEFDKRRKNKGHLANDQLLNAIYLLASAQGAITTGKEELIDDLYQPLGGGAP